MHKVEYAGALRLAESHSATMPPSAPGTGHWGWLSLAQMLALLLLRNSVLSACRLG